MATVVHEDAVSGSSSNYDKFFFIFVIFVPRYIFSFPKDIKSYQELW